MKIKHMIEELSKTDLAFEVFIEFEETFAPPEIEDYSNQVYLRNGAKQVKVKDFIAELQKCNLEADVYIDLEEAHAIPKIEIHEGRIYLSNNA